MCRGEACIHSLHFHSLPLASVSAQLRVYYLMKDSNVALSRLDFLPFKCYEVSVFERDVTFCRSANNDKKCMKVASRQPFALSQASS